MMAVMAPLCVTPGAVRGVPISGVQYPGLTRQVTKLVHVSAAAARSEPQGHLPAAGRAPGDEHVAGQVAGAGWCTRGAGGTSVDQGYAHHPGGNECIYGPLLGQAGAGTGKNSARDGARTVPGTVPEPAITRPHDTQPPDTRTPDTRHPPTAMYPGYYVTRWRHNSELLLLYPISELTLRVAYS